MFRFESAYCVLTCIHVSKSHGVRVSKGPTIWLSTVQVSRCPTVHDFPSFWVPDCTLQLYDFPSVRVSMRGSWKSTTEQKNSEKFFLVETS